MDENADEADEFGSTKSYELYCADVIKGIEMVNILIDSNEFYLKTHKVSGKYWTLTNMMNQVKSTLGNIEIRLNKN